MAVVGATFTSSRTDDVPVGRLIGADRISTKHVQIGMARSNSHRICAGPLRPSGKRIWGWGASLTKNERCTNDADQSRTPSGYQLIAACAAVMLGEN